MSAPEVRFCTCSARVPLSGSVAMTLDRCWVCRCLQRHQLTVGQLQVLGAFFGEHAAQLRNQGYPRAAADWAHEARQVKRELSLRIAPAESVHG